MTASSKLPPANILITGGAGFIGSNLVDRLLEQGHTVLCIDDFNDFYDPRIKRKNIEDHLKNPRYTLVEADIRDTKKIFDTFTAFKPQIVVHLAARAGVRPSLSEPLLYQDTNVKGTTNILEASRMAGVKRILFASSSSVYGNNEKVPFSETDPVDNPISPYAATKKAGELLCYTYHHLYKIPIACLRFFTVYGPRQRPEMAIHSFIRSIDEGKKIKMFGAGDTFRDYTYVEDIVSGILGCLTAPLSYDIINLGNSQTVSLKDLISTIQHALGKKAVIEQLPEQPGDVKRTFADTHKAQRLFGYAPKTSIVSGITKMVDWYRSNK